MKDSTKNGKIKEAEGALIVGIDVGSEEHNARFFDDRNREIRKPVVVHNDREGFEALVQAGKEAAAAGEMTKIVFGMEPTGHYWFPLAYFAQEEGIQIVLVNPAHVKATKEVDDNSPSKNDRKDPRTIADLVARGCFLEPYLPAGVYAELRGYTHLYWGEQKEISRLKNQIWKHLAVHFPEHKEVYADPFGRGSMAILGEGLLPGDIAALGDKGIVAIWEAEHVKAHKTKAPLLVEVAGRSVGTTEGANAAREELRMLVRRLQEAQRMAERLIQLMEGELAKVPFADELTKIKGVGTVMAATFLGETGPVTRFQCAPQLQKLAGLEIVNSESGKKKGKSHISRRGRRLLRKILFRIALSLIRNNKGFKELHEYYTTRKQNRLEKMQSIIAVACKASRVMYMILKTGKPFDEAKMLKDIVRPA